MFLIINSLYLDSLVVNISNHILKIKEEVEAELFGENPRRYHVDINTTGDSRFEVALEVEAELFGQDANRGGLADTNSTLSVATSCVIYVVLVRARLRVVVLSQTPMTSLVSWRNSLPQLRTDPWTLSEKTVNLMPESTLDSRKSMNMMCKNNLAHRLQELKSGGPASTLIKAELPFSTARRSKDCVLKTVKGMLNNPTLKKLVLLKGQLIDSGITSADTLKEAIEGTYKLGEEMRRMSRIQNVWTRRSSLSNRVLLESFLS
ncbi:hypothetical protein KY290_030598 [Solanum tuberosum]|uniref:Uncharacterized protein n=1 Tax=Solanum tuberosum TaxID=4113 RepID=A0ABQ7U730_SOLTU|nr:hypothetical protein KY290_030598 [Solanum tuberosum]